MLRLCLVQTIARLKNVQQRKEASIGTLIGIGHVVDVCDGDGEVYSEACRDS